MDSNQIIVIGAGAGGMLAAGRAAEAGADVLLLEKSAAPGNKILISGKTRCNITNSKELEEFIPMFGANGRFLYNAFNRYFRDDLLALLKRYGVETKTERGGRIFPVSDNAGDVVKALMKYVSDNGVRMQTGIRVTDILTENGIVTGIKTTAQSYPAKAVIIAAGGASYPATGSTGDGYRMAADLNHTIVPLRPALVPLVVEEVELAKSMQGVTLKNVRLTAYQCEAHDIDPSMTPLKDSGRGIPGKSPKLPVIESRMGDMMMTHFGIGGPITLLMSLAVSEALENGAVSVAIDLKPALSFKELSERLQRDFDTYSKRSYRNILRELLPQKLIEPFIEMSHIQPDKCGNQINASEKERLLLLLKSLRFNIKSTLPLSTAMVTAGGVSLKEIDPRTMASKLVKGLYFCGEVMDIDAETGGYNLQAAFSTGYVAGESASGFVTEACGITDR
ncbi:MAG: NAD(P)/FAD-dependent oxidoreductase [Dehalococcoidales bacterium]|nr:NAD(P)/FAD-dependent oxidoreductase [Dehalococcoidales bacterium]